LRQQIKIKKFDFSVYALFRGDCSTLTVMMGLINCNRTQPLTSSKPQNSKANTNIQDFWDTHFSKPK